MDWQVISQKLREPFAAEDIEWRVGSTNSDKTRGIALAYLTNRAIQVRLDEVVGCGGWRNDYREWHDKSQLCGISIWDDDKKEWITKWDGADSTDIESTKGGLSDAMKRAAVQWGIGRYLYHLPNEWVALEPSGRSYKLKQPPILPNWALPGGSGKPESSTPDPRQDTPPKQRAQRPKDPKSELVSSIHVMELEGELSRRVIDRPAFDRWIIENFEVSFDTSGKAEYNTIPFRFWNKIIANVKSKELKPNIAA